MYILISFSMAIAPALYLVRYFHKKDRAKPEPKQLIVKIFILGIFSTAPVVILEGLVVGLFGRFFRWSPLLNSLFKAFIVAGLCEEYIKLRVVKKYAYNNVHFDEVMDGIVYTVIASLGFACMENILYVMHGGIRVAILRAFTSVPMHAACSGIMGYYIGMAKFAQATGEERRLMRKGFWIAVALHGLYDFPLFLSSSMIPVISLSIFPLVFFTFKKLKSKIKMAIEEDSEAGRV